MKKLFKKNYTKIPEDVRMSIIERSSKQVSRGVFFSTVIIIASFLPVFLLTGQEGKLFGPLAYTKSFILLVDAILEISDGDDHVVDLGQRLLQVLGLLRGVRRLHVLTGGVEDGAAVQIDVRGNLMDAVVTKPPFVR